MTAEELDKLLSPMQIARAWQGVSGHWCVRRNKAHDRKQWEAVFDPTPGEDTVQIIGRFSDQYEAHKAIERHEMDVRGAAVLADIKWCIANAIPF